MKLINVKEVVRMRECTKCKVEKPEVHFKMILSRGKRVRNTQCSECVAEYKRKHYEDNRDSYLNRSKRWREDNPEKYRESLRKYQLDNHDQLSRKAKERNQKTHVRERNNARFRSYRSDPDFLKKEKARGMINKRILSGKIDKPDTCESCGSNGYVEGHHEDYDKPLEVIWLCKQCHEDIHHSNEGRIS